MAIIDAPGLFSGDRLARCSDEAKLYWPYFYIASNGYGRLELDADKLRSKVFSAFRTPPSEEQILQFFKEYHNNYLAFLYVADGQLWAQWDTPAKYLPRYKTAADRDSPAPPPAEFAQWLKQRVDLKSASTATVTAMFGKLPKVSEDFRKFRAGVGVGVGVGVGEGKGGGEGEETAAPSALPPSGGSPTPSEEKQKTKLNPAVDPAYRDNLWASLKARVRLVPDTKPSRQLQLKVFEVAGEHLTSAEFQELLQTSTAEELVVQITDYRNPPEIVEWVLEQIGGWKRIKLAEDDGKEHIFARREFDAALERAVARGLTVAAYPQQHTRHMQRTDDKFVISEDKE
jgi:hypothetical protein